MPGPRRSRDGPSGITDRTLVWGQAGNSTSLQWATSSDSFVAGTTAGVLVHVPAPTVHRVVDPWAVWLTPWGLATPSSLPPSWLSAKKAPH